MSFLSGCAAVWGGAHSVVEQNPNGIAIQYDPAFTSTIRAQVLAKEHCKQFGKIPEPLSAEMPGILLGIVEERYACVSPQAGQAR